MPFKQCPLCLESWKSRDDFLDDANLSLIGYQADFGDLKAGILLFNHSASQCGTTLALEVREMLDLYPGPTFETSRKGSDQCDGHCLTVENLQMCDAPCRNARVRQVMKIILERERQNRL